MPLTSAQMSNRAHRSNDVSAPWGALLQTSAVAFSPRESDHLAAVVGKRHLPRCSERSARNRAPLRLVVSRWSYVHQAHAPGFARHRMVVVSGGSAQASVAFHVFSSRLSSLRKRQSVPSAIILSGVELIKPISFSRSA